MRNPNGYGSVIDLGKNRRKRYAVRISNGYKKNNEGKVVQLYKYLGYFNNRRDANIFLGKYNAGEKIKEHESLQKCPTFEVSFEKWFEDFLVRKEKSGEPASSQLQYAYKAAFKKCGSIYNKKVCNIGYQDLQDIADSLIEKSMSTVNNVKFVLSETLRYCRKQRYIETLEVEIGDIDFSYKVSESSIHCSFARDEVKTLWKNTNDSNVRIILIMIYTGLRIEELLIMKNEDVYLKERYMIGGVKTKAGKGRRIPIADKIHEYVSDIHNSNTYLLDNASRRYSRDMFLGKIWEPTMEKYCMSHLPHDTKYTCASLLDRAEVNKNSMKMILGHKREGVTDGVYVQKDLEDLLFAINKI